MRDLKHRNMLVYLVVLLTIITGSSVKVVAESPYRFLTWNVTYSDIYPLGVKQQVSTTFYYLLFHLV